VVWWKPGGGKKWINGCGLESEADPGPVYELKSESESYEAEEEEPGKQGDKGQAGISGDRVTSARAFVDTVLSAFIWRDS